MSLRKLSIMTVLLVAVAAAACATPTPAPTATPMVIKETVVVPGPTAVVKETVVVQPTAKPVDAPGSVQLNASGATFPQPLYEDWAFAFNQRDPSVVINYAGGGSGQARASRTSRPAQWISPVQMPF